MVGVRHALNFFNIDRNDAILYVFIPKSRDISTSGWISRLDKEEGFKVVRIFTLWSILSSFFIKSQSTIEYTNCLLHLSKYSVRLFSPIYNTDSVNLAIKILTPNKFYVLDDGNASFSVVIQRKKRKKPAVYFFLSTIYHRRNMFKLPEKIFFFTKYHLPTFGLDESVIYEEPKYKNTLEFDRNSIIILGSSISEKRRFKSRIVNFNDYLSVLTALSIKFINKKIYYYAHRKESYQHLKVIEKLGFIIVRNSKPFEHLFADFKSIPYVIFSFGSPILDNIGRRYESLPRMITIKMNLETYPNKGADFKLIYEDFEKKNYLEVLPHNEINSFRI